jgi:hypothetical protein
MATRKNVPARTVREWFAGLDPKPEGVPAPGSRGRLHPTTIEAFHKANKGLRYETASEAEKPTITVKVPAKDARGRNITKTMTVTTEYARNLLGHEKGKRGRFDREALVNALTETVSA